MSISGNEKMWKVKGINALRACFFSFFFGVFGGVFVIYQFGGKSKFENIIPESIRKVLEKIGKQDGPAPKAPALLDQVESDFDITTQHYVTAGALNCVLGGVLANKGDVFIRAGRKYGVSPAFLAAVAIHESGNGKSRLAQEKNNPVGALKGGKTPYTFESVDEAITFTAKNLSSRRYVAGGNKTVAQIQRIYCPVGAKNDPRSLNKYWLSGVLKNMNYICKKERDLSSDQINVVAMW